MAEASTNEQVLAATKAMIDGLKTVCANASLANDSSEYKIITEGFAQAFDAAVAPHDANGGSCSYRSCGQVLSGQSSPPERFS